MKISFVIASRNDQYCGDSVGRLSNTLSRIFELMPDSEVVVADWGSERPLARVFASRFKNGPDGIDLKFITIPPSVTSKFPTPFSEVHALNCAVRHAGGEWIGRLDQDVLIGRPFARVCEISVLGGDNIFFSGRREGFERDSPVNPDCIAGGKTEFYRGAIGILMAKAKVWRECRGYDESMIHRLHMEHDLCVRMQKLMPLCDIGPALGYPFYHQPHLGPEGRAENPCMSDTALRIAMDGKIAINDDNWGLRDYDSQITVTRI